MKNLSRILIAMLLLALVLPACTPKIPDIPVAVVFLRYEEPYCPDGPEACMPWWPPEARAKIRPPRHTAQEYEAILNTVINEYYHKATYGAVQWDFQVLVNPGRADGWWNAPHTPQGYNQGASLYQDGVEVAAQAIGSALSGYQHLVIIQGYQGRAGQSCCVHVPYPYYSVPKTYSTSNGDFELLISWVGEDEDDDSLAHILSHELGHLLGAPDQYQDGTGPFTGMGPYDLMGADWYFPHFGGWTKLDRGWLNSAEDLPCTSGVCELDATLRPLEYQNATLLRIPISTNPFLGYMVECRQQVNGDERIPEAGLLISRVDEALSGSQIAIAQVKSATNNFLTATLKPGEVFVDSSQHLAIRNLSQPGDPLCALRAERNGPAVPDPRIWTLSPVEKSGYLLFNSDGIWVDSPANGWDVYPDNETVFGNDPPIPSGLGDPFWVGQENRIGFQITNAGSADAIDVLVDVYVQQPVAFTPPLAVCPAGEPVATGEPVLVGTATIPLLKPFEEWEGYVTWTPLKMEPAQVTVKIRDYEGEITHSNNTAQETYLKYYYPVSQTASESARSRLVLNVPDTCQLPIEYVVMPIREGCGDGPDRGWRLETSSDRGRLSPGESLEIAFEFLPPENSRAGDHNVNCLGVFILQNDVFTTIGGLAVLGEVVEPSTITCRAPEGTVPLGSNAPVSGAISPTPGSAIAALTYRDPAGNSTLRSVLVNAEGQYQDGLVPAMTGVWTVQAYWQGNASLGAAQSEICQFTVGDAQGRPIFRPAQDVLCRQGPSTLYPVTGSFSGGRTLPVTGRSDDGGWFQVLDDRNGLQCWINAGLGELEGSAQGVPVLSAPPLPPEPPTPVPACLVGSAISAPVCVQPCPPGANPGTACTIP